MRLTPCLLERARRNSKKPSEFTSTAGKAGHARGTAALCSQSFFHFRSIAQLVGSKYELALSTWLYTFARSMATSFIEKWLQHETSFQDNLEEFRREMGFMISLAVVVVLESRSVYPLLIIVDRASTLQVEVGSGSRTRKSTTRQVKSRIRLRVLDSILRAQKYVSWKLRSRTYSILML